MLKGFISRLRYSRRFGPIWAKIQPNDDFSWKTYTQDSYRPNLEHASQKETRRLADVSWNVTNGKIQLADGSCPFHPTHRLVYETVLWLRPKSVCEFGFGGGDHLANLRLLLPEAELSGYEISEEQLRFALERNDLRTVTLDVRDMTVPQVLRSAELVFTNAVMMHIHGGDRHLTFLRNMLAVSTRYVLFAENWLRHDFAKSVRETGHTPLLLRGENVCAVLIDQRNEVELPETTDRELRKFRY